MVGRGKGEKIRDPAKWDLYCSKDHNVVMEWGIKPSMEGKKTLVTVRDALALTDEEILDLPIY